MLAKVPANILLKNQTDLFLTQPHAWDQRGLRCRHLTAALAPRKVLKVVITKYRKVSPKEELVVDCIHTLAQLARTELHQSRLDREHTLFANIGLRSERGKLEEEIKEGLCTYFHPGRIHDFKMRSQSTYTPNVNTIQITPIKQVETPYSNTIC